MSHLGVSSPEAALTWSAVLLGGFVVLGAAIWWVCRRVFAGGAAATDGEWTLQNLRQMRADGVISEEEFARLKEKMLNSPQTRMLREAPGPDGRSDKPR